MNTNDNVGKDTEQVKKDQKDNTESKKSTFDFAFFGESPDSRIKVINALNSVDLSSTDADKNAHSISDNNGGRIELEQDEQDVIKK